MRADQQKVGRINADSQKNEKQQLNNKESMDSLQMYGFPT